MRFHQLLSIGLIALSVSGCVYNDGAFTYTASGRLVDEHQQAVGGCPIVVSLGRIVPATQPADISQCTFDDGRFSQKLMTGLAWGYTSLFGVIPLGSTNPKPPPLDHIYIGVESAPGCWVQRELTLNKAQQQDRGTVELGDVSIPK